MKAFTFTTYKKNLRFSALLFLTVSPLYTAPQAVTQQAVEPDMIKQAFIEQTDASLKPSDIVNIEAHSTDVFDQEDQAEPLAISDEDPTLDLTDETLDDAATKVAYKKINEIIIIGNTQVLDAAILNAIPYRVGEPFNPQKTRLLIRNLYYKMRRFRNISVYAQPAPEDTVDLYIVVEEKKALNEIIIKGNHALTETEILAKLNLGDIPAIDEEELPNFAQLVKKMYREKNFHDISVTTELQSNDDGTANAIFTIDEGRKALVKHICFKGNCAFSSKELRSILYTKEDWILSFMDNAGSYDPERTELGDKGLIEQYYQNKGYLNAKVVDIDVHMDECTKEITLTFEIKEGDIYTVEEVHAPGNDLISEERLLSCLPIRPGDIYSREAIVESLKTLEIIWGDFGHIYAHIDPSIIPNPETKTVNITFYSELGSKVFLNRLNIVGNRKTQDKVIRRKLLLQEGRLLTNRYMEESKRRVESMGYFDQRGGVNLKTVRLNEELADLDVIVKEVKTGRFNGQLGFGGADRSSNSNISGLSLGLTLADTNFRGSGVNFNLEGKIGAEQRSINFSIFQPWMFDRPIIGALDCYYKQTNYDELKRTKPVHERLAGGNFSTGVVRRLFNYDTQFLFRVGIENVHFQHREHEKAAQADFSSINNAAENAAAATIEYQTILDKQFKAANFVWFTGDISQDYVNHPVFPSDGYRWSFNYKLGAPIFDSTVGFHKVELDANWFTPLIGDRDLIFRLHAHFGALALLKKTYTAPYRELFHIGGATNVRGFQYGQVSPLFLGDSIGGTKAFFVNAEFIFPITSDFSMRGVLFYDGGSGWDNPYYDETIAHSPRPAETARRFMNNSFDYRHAVGIGIRLTQPAPIKLDWGFKIDPRKKLRETAQEVHFGMSYDF